MPETDITHTFNFSALYFCCIMRKRDSFLPEEIPNTGLKLQSLHILDRVRSWPFEGKKIRSISEWQTVVSQLSWCAFPVAWCRKLPLRRLIAGSVWRRDRPALRVAADHTDEHACTRPLRRIQPLRRKPTIFYQAAITSVSGYLFHMSTWFTSWDWQA